MAALSNKPVLLAHRLLHNGKGRPCGLFAQSARTFSQNSQFPILPSHNSFQVATSRQSNRVQSYQLRPSFGARFPSIGVRHASTKVDPALVKQMPPPGVRPGSQAAADPSTEQAINAQQSAPVSAPVDAAPADGLVQDPLVGDLGTSVPLPETYIGYLADQGIDLGGWTSGLVQMLVEYVQVNSGVSWLAAVTIATLLVRIATIPLTIRASDTSARLATLNPVLKPLRDRLLQERMQKSPDLLATQKELRAIYRTHKINPWKAMIPLIIQAPFGFGMWRLTRAMGHNDLPGLSNAGMLWFPNLTIADPTFLLPIFGSAALYFSLKIGVDGQGSASGTVAGKYLLIGMPIFSLVAVAFMPAICQLAILVGSIFALGQTYAISSPRVREVLGIQPLPPRDASAPTTLTPQKRIEGLMNTAHKQVDPDSPEMKEPKSFVDKQLRALKKQMESAKKLSKEPGKSLGAKLRQMTGEADPKKTRLTPEQRARAEKYDRMRREELFNEKNNQDRRRK